jgi:phenylacetate-CoA ligase
VLGAATSKAKLSGSISHLEDLLSICLEDKVRVKEVVLDAFPPKVGKRRPIRREMA